MGARGVADTIPAHVDWFDYLGVKTALLPRAARVRLVRRWSVFSSSHMVVAPTGFERPSYVEVFKTVCLA